MRLNSAKDKPGDRTSPFSYAGNTGFPSHGYKENCYTHCKYLIYNKCNIFVS